MHFPTSGHSFFIQCCQKSANPQSNPSDTLVYILRLLPFLRLDTGKKASARKRLAKSLPEVRDNFCSEMVIYIFADENIFANYGRAKGGSGGGWLGET